MKPFNRSGTAHRSTSLSHFAFGALVACSSPAFSIADPGPVLADGAISGPLSPLVLKLSTSLNAPPASSIEKAPPASEQNTNGGMFDVTALDAERALERSLTQSGALLLPVGQAELQISGQYARTSQQVPALVTQGTQLAVGTIDSRRSDYSASLSARFGLPLDAQLEFDLPYRFIKQSVIEPIDFTASRDTATSASGLGDLTVGIAKTLAREQGRRPDIVARVAYNTGSGQEVRNSLATGDGFKKIRGGITLLKRQDPMVFTSNFFVESTFKKNGIKPGNQLGVSLSALLAASPDTSVSIGLDQVFSKQTRINGAGVAGSDQVSSMLVFGATSMIGKQTLLSVSTGVGLTKASPDYFVNVAMPIRFELFK